MLFTVLCLFTGIAFEKMMYVTDSRLIQGKGVRVTATLFIVMSRSRKAVSIFDALINYLINAIFSLFEILVVTIQCIACRFVEYLLCLTFVKHFIF